MMPEKSAIASAVRTAHADHAGDTGGANASYIPYLASVDPSLFGVCVATADGDVFEAGDAGFEFALESISKVCSMALAMEHTGLPEFHDKVGADPTGEPFNSVIALALHGGKPLSPLVNAGAMSTVSLIPAASADERWQKILAMQSAFAGRDILLSDAVNDSEQSTNFHNRAIAWLLYSSGSMYSDPMEACEVYTRQCSTLVTTRDLAVMGATVAARGRNPVTGKQVFDPSLVPPILAEMTMEGLYTSSGDWAYRVGLPGKSGVGGGVLAIMPGTLAIAAFSPPLDPAGNSVRAQKAVASVAAALKLNIYNATDFAP
ncbi:glutaminase A [Arthrobacter sp. zg-Y820]|uniref:glutaminase A n=1 Tax=unclassified Arthrobacter TaxID=235627 RepID=UPI001E43911F|nr:MULTISPECIES: glutaminase A [unclassified Arthrobacter]MCC9196564.1 glutaminase A [Arthrobacter sp. zg-Y820]MDK1279426.1 glutaminase A [Arthrobacter sp. zg.Y820]WIB08193.1 glutaminase A [Arthrobacter sp. zg-Y820]